MKIILNGETRPVGAARLDAALAELGFAGPVATALNGRFVPVADRATTDLADGDRLEVVAPRQGG